MAFLIILQVPKVELKNIEIIKVSGFNLSWIDNLRDLIVEQERLLLDKKNAPLIYLVTSPEIDPYSGLLGLILGLRKEPYCRNLRALICQQEGIHFDTLKKEMLKNDDLLAINVINVDGVWGHYVHAFLSRDLYKREISLKEIKDQAFLQIGVPGDLTTLNWQQGFNHKTLEAPGFTTIEVHYAALNFKDIMLATGSIQAEMRSSLPNILESPLGFEFSGVVGNKRVFGYSEGQGIATQVLADSQNVWDIPKHWSFEDAATVSVVYSTVYLALVLRGSLSEGESILIHAGAGGVGQAAIRIALSMNCNVFTTVGSKEKVAFIRKEFPQVKMS
jgi:fatty acid synthase